MTFVLDYATDYRHLHHNDIDALHSSKKNYALYVEIVCAYICCYFLLHRHLYLSPLICYIERGLYNQEKKIELLGISTVQILLLHIPEFAYLRLLFLLLHIDCLTSKVSVLREDNCFLPFVDCRSSFE